MWLASLPARSLRRRGDDDGELRAAVGTVLRPDPAALDRQQPAGDPEAHARARRARLRRVAAVEPLEEVRQVGRRDAGTVIAHLDHQPFVGHSRAARRSSSPAGAVLGGVLQQVRQRRGGQTRIEPHRHIRVDVHVQRVPLQRRARPGRAPRRRSPTDASSAIRRRSPPASMRAISRMFWNSRVRRSTSARIRSLCSSRSSAVSARRLDVARRDTNGRERRAQIVSQRREQRRLQLLALARQLGRLALFEKLRALDGDRHDAAERVERARPRSAGRRRRAGRWVWCRPAAARAGSCDRRPPSSGGRRRSGRRRRTRARSAPSQRPWRAARVSSAIVTAPASKTSQSLARGSAMRDELQVEPAGDRSRQRRRSPRGCR